jgi:hypothetical protein
MWEWAVQRARRRRARQAARTAHLDRSFARRSGVSASAPLICCALRAPIPWIGVVLSNPIAGLNTVCSLPPVLAGDMGHITTTE